VTRLRLVLVLVVVSRWSKDYFVIFILLGFLVLMVRIMNRLV
jgi:hypothetical protein